METVCVRYLYVTLNLITYDSREEIGFLYVTDKTTERIRYLNITERPNVFTGIARKERTT